MSTNVDISRLFYGALQGILQRTAVRLRVARIASLLAHVSENSPQDCFLPQALPAPSLFESLLLHKVKNGHNECCNRFLWRAARDSNP